MNKVRIAAWAAAAAVASTSWAQVSFRSAADTSASDETSYLATGDFDFDGNVDVVVCNRAASTAQVFFGDGTGDFALGQTIAFDALARPVHAVVFDTESDGDLDIVITLVGSDEIAILLNDGEGGFATPVTRAVGNQPQFTEPVAIDNEDEFDLVTANAAEDTISVLISNPGGTYQDAFPVAVQVAAQQTRPFSVAGGDLNADGNADLVIALRDRDQIGVLLGNGDGTFSELTRFIAGGDPFVVRLADFDGDNNLDAAVANATGGAGVNPNEDTVSIFLGNGDGTFAPAMDFVVGNRPEDLDIVDMDGDGNLDLISANFEGDNVSVLLGNGDGTFGDPEFFTTGNGPTSVFAADVNNDGDLDLLSANLEADTFSVLIAGEDPAILDPSDILPVFSCPFFGFPMLALTLAGMLSMDRGLRRRRNT